MKKSKEQVQYYLAKIRSLVAMKHTRLPLREMQKELEAMGTHLDLHYIGKLRDMVFQEMIDEIENQRKQEVSEFLTETKKGKWMQEMFDMADKMSAKSKSDLNEDSNDLDLT